MLTILVLSLLLITILSLITNKLLQGTGRTPEEIIEILNRIKEN